MLTRLELQHFKCFAALKLPLRPLTLLSGPNASGKSSAMQPLVLLHQTTRQHEWSTRLMLNGAAVHLGTAAEVIDQLQGRRNCGIALLDVEDEQDHEYRWTFEGERDEMSMIVSRVGVDDTEEVEPKRLKHLLPESDRSPSLSERLCGLTYLTAERLGPREYYTLDDPQLTPVVGSRGEHSVSVLHSGRDNRVLEALTMPDVPPTRLRQVGAWMRQFFPGCELEIEKVSRANAVTLGLRTDRGTEFHRPIHTGFGLTQVLPIIVAALSASRNDLLLIENPEVHLHPAGQAAMGRFLGQVAAAGVQVIVETHSDHVLNGIRRAVKNETLSAADVVLHFFRPRLEDGEDKAPQVESPNLDANGNIDTWPDGFFDQFDKDMNHFANWH